MARLSEEKIQLIKELYPQIGTYSGVAKEVGCSPATVKRYVTEDAPAAEVSNKEYTQKFTGTIPEIDENLKNQLLSEIQDMCKLSDEEIEDMKILMEDF